MILVKHLRESLINLFYQEVDPLIITLNLKINTHHLNANAGHLQKTHNKSISPLYIAHRIILNELLRKYIAHFVLARHCLPK